jgi:hypothetical protein
MAYFILGLVVGLSLGIFGTHRVYLSRAKGDEALAATSALVVRPPGSTTVEPPPITKKAAKLGIRPEDLTPSDDILVRMQRAWEQGISLEELDAREASSGSGPGPGPVPPPDEEPPTTRAKLLADSVSTVTDAVALLAREGYGDDLHLDGEGLDCRACGTTHPTDLVEVDRVFRFEGPSDPADEAIVLGLRCPACGARGSLVSAFGPDADPALAHAFVYLAAQAGHG